MKLYFVTVNSFKALEVKDYLSSTEFELQPVNYQIQEILNLDLDVIVRDKTLKAYQQIGLPCVVEHGGLLIDELNDLPGGLSKVVWDTLGDRVCNFLRKDQPRGATAKSVIGYCDGKQIKLFTGTTRGTVSESGRGDYKFQWDPIFIPEGSSQTYGEIGFPGKKPFSQAAKAWAKLVTHISTTRADS